ncbi:MAG TPA: ABC transporter permease [Longimicrobiales bacterium]|nr:ABC transporter permease [Longimicrobiales bacterium]
MAAIRRAIRLVRALLHRGALEREMGEEMGHHLELEIEDRVRGGMSPGEARRTARRDFGAVERWKEEGRASRGLGGWDALRQDVRYGTRTLVRAPGFTAVAVLTLAVGIGATAGVFGVVEALLIEPLGYREAGRVVRILEHRTDGERRYGTISAPNFRDWLAAAETLGEGSLYDESSPTLRLGERSVKVSGAWVNASYFDVLGVEPAVGRFFLAEEDEPGSARMVLSEGLWRELFAGDPGVVGRVLEVNGFPYTVVGVAESFEDPGLSGASFEAPRLWRSTPSYFLTNGRQSRSFTGIARLASGATPAAAAAELNAIHARLAETHAGNRGRLVEVVPLKESLVGDARPVLAILSAAVLLVLLIACANVANLLLFRAAGRGREMGVRTALGASRRRVVRQLLVESLLLGLAGAAAGLVVAVAVNRGLEALAAGQLPRLANVGVDPTVLGFTALVGIAASLVFGLLPALHTVRPDTAAALRDGGRGTAGARAHGRIRDAVVAVQVGLAVVVMVGAGLLGRSLVRLGAVDPGLSVEGALTLRIDPPSEIYGPAEEDGGASYHAVLSRVTVAVEAVPGVESVAVVDILPMSGSFNGNPYLLEGQPEPAEGQSASAETRAVGPGYFETHGIVLRAGRDVGAGDDREAPPVVWVNEALLRREGRSADGAVGTRIRILGDRWAAIAGVVGDVAQFTLDRSPDPAVYIPLPQAPLWMQDEPWLVVRTAADPAGLAPAIRAAVAGVDPAIPVYDIAPMEDVLRATLARPRFRTVVLLAFAAAAFLLAAVGVYGMVAYTVARRRPELGIRMALGADARAIRRLVVLRGLGPVAVGAAAGLAAGLLATRALAAFLFGISTTDPATFLAAPLLLLAVAGIAAWLPARRAGRLAPQEVLRVE